MTYRAPLIAAAAMFFTSSALADTAEISAPDAHAKAQEGLLTIVDVRRPSEWAETGLPQGAVGATLQDRDFVAQVLAALNGDKSAPVALSCRTGRRSARAASILERAGFTSVYNLREGWAGRSGSGPGWDARGLPVDEVAAD